MHGAVIGFDRRSYMEVTVGRISVLHALACAPYQLRAHAPTSARISRKNDRPAARAGTPKYSATVAPRSAKLLRSPKATARIFGPSTSTGTASREWSVRRFGRWPWASA